MVKLDKIYTRSGDEGITSLGDGTRAQKNSIRLMAIGEIDETNTAIGLAHVEANKGNPDMATILSYVQNDLFDLGADISRPGNDPGDGKLRITEIQVKRLEQVIDKVNEALSALTSFVLPGGDELAARLHLARATARRAERAMVTLTNSEPVNQQALIYINRLSDLLFVLARAANDNGKTDVLWQPGLTRGRNNL